MRIAIVAAAVFLISCGRSERPASQAKVYSTDDVSQELSAAGVQLNSSPDVVRAFFAAHPAYRLCKDSEAGLIAVIQDLYIVIAYRDGKVSNLDIGSAMFSAGNVASYCT
jgi:hypothetical protein